MYKVFLCTESNQLHMVYVESEDLIEYEFHPEKYQLLKYDRKRVCQAFVEEWQGENQPVY